MLLVKWGRGPGLRWYGPYGRWGLLPTSGRNAPGGPAYPAGALLSL